MDQTEQETARRIRAAVRESIPGELTTKVIVVAETFDSDGKRGIWIVADPDLMPWERMGLLEYAAQRTAYEDDED